MIADFISIRTPWGEFVRGLAPRCPDTFEIEQPSSSRVSTASSDISTSAKRLEQVRGTPRLEGLELARLVHNTIPGHGRGPEHRSSAWFVYRRHCAQSGVTVRSTAQRVDGKERRAEVTSTKVSGDGSPPWDQGDDYEFDDNIADVGYTQPLATPQDRTLISVGNGCARAGDAKADAWLYSGPSGRRDVYAIETLYVLRRETRAKIGQGNDKCLEYTREYQGIQIQKGWKNIYLAVNTLADHLRTFKEGQDEGSCYCQSLNQGQEPV
ncbi:hypothetical protein HOY82DRAFT_535433 [Tuber indicum]|nr:hypothetical protein HOY82DRAFT_535433 [Tuber indicum]